MSVNGIGTAGYPMAGYEPEKSKVNTTAEGVQRFDRELLGRKPQTLPSFVGKVYTEEELYQYVDKKVQQNQGNKKTLADMIKNSCTGWASATFKFVGEPKAYNYYEFIKELENRSEHNR